jgi:hypothetical protein
MRSNHAACNAAPEPVQSPLDELLNLERSKRSRKPPAWVTGNVVVDAEAVPATLAAATEQAAREQPKRAVRGTGPTRMTKWQLLDRDTILCEMDHAGHKWAGQLTRTGLAPTTGTVLTVRLQSV